MEKKASRVAYGETLLELGKENPDIVVLDADLSGSTKTALFAKEFPDRQQAIVLTSLFHCKYHLH